MSILPDFSTEELRKRKSDLEGYLEKAKYKGNKKDVKGISTLINEVDREIADREEGIASEYVNFGRAVARGATLGALNDDRLASIRSIGDIFETKEEAADLIAQSRRLSKDNAGSEMAGEFLGTAAVAVSNARVVGAGATKLGTFGRQGALAIAESMPYSYRNLESAKQFAQNQDFVEGIDELGYIDFVKEINQLVMNGAIGGGLGAVTMRNAQQWGSARSSKDYVPTQQGAKTQADELADEPLDQVSQVAMEAQPMINEAFEKARASRERIRGKLDDGPVQPPTMGIVKRPGQHQFSMLDEKPWVNRKTPEELQDQTKGWRDASTAGEVVDAVSRNFKNFMKDKIFGLDNRLQWDVSREVGGKFQIGSEQTVREITQEIETFVKPAQRVFDLNVKDTHLQALLLDFANDSPQARSRIRMDQVKTYITEKLSAKDADAFEQYYYWSKRNSVDAMEAYTGVRNEAMLTNQFLHTQTDPGGEGAKGDRDLGV